MHVYILKSRGFRSLYHKLHKMVYPRMQTKLIVQIEKYLLLLA